MTWALGWMMRNPLLSATAAALAALLVWGTWLDWQLGRSRHETTEVKTAWAADREQATAAMLKQTEDYRVEEQRRIAAQKEVTDEADRKITQVRADAVIADAVAGRLQQRVAALVADARRAASNPGAAQASPPAGDAGLLLADMFGRLDQRASELAGYADNLRISGEACAAVYEALTP